MPANTSKDDDGVKVVNPTGADSIVTVDPEIAEHFVVKK